MTDACPSCENLSTRASSRSDATTFFTKCRIATGYALFSEDYYDTYTNPIPSSLIPIIPSLEAIEDSINGKDSCVGPDGIPFSA